MPNGYWFPKLAPGEHKTPRDRVEEYYASKKKDTSHVHSYEMYDFLRNDIQEAPDYSSYTLLQRSKEEPSEMTISTKDWSAFQAYQAFMRAKAQNETEEAGPSSF